MIKWLLIISFLIYNNECAVICPRYLNVVPVQAIATPNDRLCCTGNNMQTAYRDAPQTYDDGSLQVASYLQTHVNNGMLVSNRMEVLSHQGSNNVVNSNIRVQNISQNQPPNNNNSPGFFNNQNQQMNPSNAPIQSSTSFPFTPTPNGWMNSQYNNNQPGNIFGQQYPTTPNNQNANSQTVNGQMPNGGIANMPMANSPFVNNPTTSGQMFNGQTPGSQFSNGQTSNGQTPNGQMQNGFTQFPAQSNNMNGQPTQNNFADNRATMAPQQQVTGYNPALSNGNTPPGGLYPAMSNEQGSSVPFTTNGFSTTSMPFNPNQQPTTMQPLMNVNAQNAMNTQSSAGYMDPQQNTNRNFDYTSTPQSFSPTTQRPFTNGVQQSSPYMSTQFPNNMQNNNNNVSPANMNPTFIQNEGVNYSPSASSTVSTNGYSSPSTLYTSQGTSSSPFIMSNTNNPNRGQTQMQSTTPFYPPNSNTQQMQTNSPFSQSTTNGRVGPSATTNQYNPNNPILSTSSNPSSYTQNGEANDQFPNHILYDSQRMMNTQFGDYTSGKPSTCVIQALLAMLVFNLLI